MDIVKWVVYTMVSLNITNIEHKRSSSFQWRQDGRESVEEF